MYLMAALNSSYNWEKADEKQRYALGILRSVDPKTDKEINFHTIKHLNTKFRISLRVGELMNQFIEILYLLQLCLFRLWK
jgi:hypothetical protein